MDARRIGTNTGRLVLLHNTRSCLGKRWKFKKICLYSKRFKTETRLIEKTLQNKSQVVLIRDSILNKTTVLFENTSTLSWSVRSSVSNSCPMFMHKWLTTKIWTVNIDASSALAHSSSHSRAVVHFVVICHTVNPISQLVGQHIPSIHPSDRWCSLCGSGQNQRASQHHFSLSSCWSSHCNKSAAFTTLCRGRAPIL